VDNHTNGPLSEFEQILADWRAEGSLRGLELVRRAPRGVAW